MMSKLKIRSNYNPPVDKGEINEGKEITMPGLEDNPRQVLENHVRGINPITGAILDKQMYYGDAIVPYNKDLTFEELRIKAAALKNQLQDAETKMAALQQAAGESSNDGTSLPSTKSEGEGES
jgi:hypothetical protein